MMRCPFCKVQIDNDSHYCDHCGQALRFCPQCMEPKRGVSCPACGEDLISADEFFSASKNVGPLCFMGNGWTLPLKEGEFGRCSGIYPEFSSVEYISGRHGQLRCRNGKWQIMDSGSTNGTVVNGNKIEKGSWTDLNCGDTVLIATVQFKIESVPIDK